MTAPRHLRHDRLIQDKVRRERPTPARPSLRSVAEATLSWIQEESLDLAVRDAIALGFADRSGVTPRGAPTVTVRPAPENLRVRVPFGIAILDRCDATVDLDLRFTIAAWQGAPHVWLYQFDADVSRTAWRNVVSPGVPEEAIREVLRRSLGPRLERRIARALDQGVRRLCPVEGGQRLHSMWSDEQMIRFQCRPAATRTLPITLRAFPEVELDAGDLARGCGA